MLIEDGISFNQIKAQIGFERKSKAFALKTKQFQRSLQGMFLYNDVFMSSTKQTANVMKIQ